MEHDTDGTAYPRLTKGQEAAMQLSLSPPTPASNGSVSRAANLNEERLSVGAPLLRTNLDHAGSHGCRVVTPRFHR